jgi:hypothetical protein
MYLRVLFLFFLVLLVTQTHAWAISSFSTKAVTAVQGKPLDLSNSKSLIRASIGGIIAIVSLTVLLYFTISFDYLPVFVIGLCVGAYSEGCDYGMFEKWPISLVLLDSLGIGVSFVLIKAIYQLAFPISNRTNSNYKPNMNKRG